MQIRLFVCTEGGTLSVCGPLNPNLSLTLNLLLIKSKRKIRIKRKEEEDCHASLGPVGWAAMRHHLDFEKPIVELQEKLDELKQHPEKPSLGISFEEEVALIEKKLAETKRQVFLNLSAWDRIKI